MSEAALSLRGVRKRYGRNEALRGLTFSIPRGVISGLVGPNGAGKTTCFGVVGGLLEPDAGLVDVLGRGAFDVRHHRGLLGLLPQDCELPPHTRVRTWLRHLARLQGASTAEAARQCDRVLEAVSLRDRQDARIVELSHGMRRRVAVGQALLGAPELILLDEPVSGLDPRLVAHMRDLLRAERARGATLLVSSHLLGELEAVCDHVVFMEQGVARRCGSLGDLTKRGRIVSYRLRRAPALDELQAKLPTLELRYEQPTLLRAASHEDETPEALNARVLPVLLALDAGIEEVRPGESLEQAYLDSARERDGGSGREDDG